METFIECASSPESLDDVRGDSRSAFMVRSVARSGSRCYGSPQLRRAFWGGPGSWYGSETGATERLPLSVKIRLGYSMPSKLSFCEVGSVCRVYQENSCRFRICLDL